MNRAIFIGRLTKDPELKTSQNNISILTFTIAVDREFKREGQPTADFINCVAWGNTAEFISKYFTKGRMIAIEGSVQTRSWEDNDGKKHYVTEIPVRRVEFCGDKPKNSNNSVANTESNDFDGEVPDDDLPF